MRSSSFDLLALCQGDLSNWRILKSEERNTVLMQALNNDYLDPSLEEDISRLSLSCKNMAFLLLAAALKGSDNIVAYLLDKHVSVTQHLCDKKSLFQFYLQGRQDLSLIFSSISDVTPHLLSFAPNRHRVAVRMHHKYVGERLSSRYTLTAKCVSEAQKGFDELLLLVRQGGFDLVKKEMTKKFFMILEFYLEHQEKHKALSVAKDYLEVLCKCDREEYALVVKELYKALTVTGKQNNTDVFIFIFKCVQSSFRNDAFDSVEIDDYLQKIITKLDILPENYLVKMNKMVDGKNGIEKLNHMLNEIIEIYQQAIQEQQANQKKGLINWCCRQFSKPIIDTKKMGEAIQSVVTQLLKHMQLLPAGLEQSPALR